VAFSLGATTEAAAEAAAEKLLEQFQPTSLKTKKKQ